MTMVSTGPISLGGSATSGGLNQSVNIELGRSATASINMNESAVRTLAGVASGAISMSNFYGKSNRVTASFTFSTNTANASLNLSSLSGYSAGKTDITVTINSGIYLYATSTGNYGLNLTGGTTGDTLTIVNNGYIMGQGGLGANTSFPVGSAGGPALNIPINATINNTNGSAYIGGGGGGGAWAANGCDAYGGGGGAGGGAGGYGSGGAGGGIGSAGATPSSFVYMGGGGGRIFPGATSGWSYNGTGGQAGGGGGNNASGGGLGGGSNNPGGNANFPFGCGGGGGWGASGGTSGSYAPRAGSAGGKAVNLNGRTVTWVSGDTSRVWGAVS